MRVAHAAADDVDDVTPLALKHPTDRSTTAEEAAIQVYADVVEPPLRLRLPDRADVRERARIVHLDVNRPKDLLHLVDHCIYLGDLGHVGEDRHYASAGRLEFFGGPCQLVSKYVHYRDVCTPLAISHGDGSADPPRRSSHHRNRTVQFHVTFLSPANSWLLQGADG